MRALDHVHPERLAELLVSAAGALVEERVSRLAPVGLPVRRGRLSLRRLRFLLGPGACAEVDLVAGFSTAAWIGRPGTDAPDLGRLVWRTTAPLDARGRVVLDRRARAYLAVADAAAFDAVVLAPSGGGLLLVPVEGFERRVEALA